MPQYYYVRTREAVVPATEVIDIRQEVSGLRGPFMASLMYYLNTQDPLSPAAFTANMQWEDDSGEIRTLGTGFIPLNDVTTARQSVPAELVWLRDDSTSIWTFNTTLLGVPTGLERVTYQLVFSSADPVTDLIQW